MSASRWTSLTQPRPTSPATSPVAATSTATFTHWPGAETVVRSEASLARASARLSGTS